MAAAAGSTNPIPTPENVLPLSRTITREISFLSLDFYHVQFLDILQFTMGGNGGLSQVSE